MTRGLGGPSRGSPVPVRTANTPAGMMTTHPKAAGPANAPVMVPAGEGASSPSPNLKPVIRTAWRCPCQISRTSSRLLKQQQCLKLYQKANRHTVVFPQNLFQKASLNAETVWFFISNLFRYYGL